MLLLISIANSVLRMNFFCFFKLEVISLTISNYSSVAEEPSLNVPYPKHLGLFKITLFSYTGAQRNLSVSIETIFYHIHSISFKSSGNPSRQDVKNILKISKYDINGIIIAEICSL